MNLEKLRRHEELFLLHYPGGFDHPAMMALSKKHQVDKWIQFVKTELSKEKFTDVESVTESLTKLVSGSSLVSVFEKTAFRNMVSGLSIEEKRTLSQSFKTLLHVNQEEGFDEVYRFLARYNNAKWPIVTSVLYYSDPEREVIIKPTTVKRVIEVFELMDIKYVTKPDYNFYKAYRAAIIEMKKLSAEELQVDNGAYCGFLMFALEHNDL